jgi:dihydropteroate synthase
MGVLNVTPDSFYDGGRYLDPSRAISHGFEMIAEGADIVDVGGESTRPGALEVDPEVELERVLPVVAALSGEVRVSIDTRHAEVAAAALDVGATLVNDVSATLATVAASRHAGLVVMHMQNTPADMQVNPHYEAVVDEVHAFLAQRAASARALGVEELYVDPGIGFGKTLEHNVALLKALPDLVRGGDPVLVGTSRKRFLGVLSAAAGEAPLPVGERLEASLATAVWAMCCGVAIVRCHDVKATADAARLVGEGAQGALREAA